MHGETEHATAELPTVFHMLHESFAHSAVAAWLFHWQNLWYTFFAMLFLIGLTCWGARKRSLIPTGLQNGLEVIVDACNQLVCGILGPQGEAHTPFLVTLFLYIFVMNALGLIPLMRSPVTSAVPSPIGLPVPLTTVPLALCAVVYVNAASLKAAGLRGYLYHMLGSPSHLILWCVSPLILVIHALGEFSKVFSLSMRLFGNIFGEDVLIAVIVQQATTLTRALHWPPVLPLQIPFLFLGLLTSFVQAAVFALLTTIYLALMLPHEEQERARAHAV
ncbi:MAG: F0F1 ATP synthase subunit A [Candidatus Omnitrophica bacterium]|nr:F0F1 ATP synthase subunit A [Candidatus Omnitrophota bacterium]